jgi:hypothetical protein
VLHLPQCRPSCQESGKTTSWTHYLYLFAFAWASN